jgi:polyisoprenoid-binding protein YceI
MTAQGEFAMKSTYEIDPSHSSIGFSIRHMMISNVRGGFSGVKGSVEYDPDDLAASGIQAQIDVSTINTSDEKRDAHLKSADFFDVEQHPHMTFVSDRIEKVGEGELRVNGNLTLHGVTKPIVLTVDEISPEGKDPWGNSRTGVSAKGKLNRKDFGLTWSAPLEAGGVLVGDDVKIEFDLQLVKKS